MYYRSSESSFPFAFIVAREKESSRERKIITPAKEQKTMQAA
jgi:hypothetical protein